MVTNRSSEFAIRVRGLRRTYGEGPSTVETVRGVDLDVRAGTITALLGTDGAGKTSTVEVLHGVAEPTAGVVSVLGMDPVTHRDAVRQRTGVLPRSSRVAEDLTVRQTLRGGHGTIADQRWADDVIDRLSLGSVADIRVASLSGEVARRFDLARTSVGRPELLILDEPATGLDPEGRRAMWDLLAELRDAGSTFLFTTARLEEAEAVADRVEILHAGHIVFSGTPAAIAAGYPSMISLDRVPYLPETTAAVASITAITRVLHEHGRTTLETHDLQSSMFALMLWAGGRDIRLNALDARRPSLETVLLSIAAGSHGETPTRARPDINGTDDRRMLESSMR